MELLKDEKIYLEGRAVNIKKGFGVYQGNLYITSERIAFYKRSGFLNFLLGPLLMHFSKGNILVFEIVLNDLKKINAENHGLGKKYAFHSSNGDFEYIQFYQNAQNWLDTVKKAVELNNPKSKISQVGQLIEFEN